MTAGNFRFAAAILLSRGDKVWLGQRSRTRFLPGFSVFPGGAREPGENDETTALRELSEETGLKWSNSIELRPFARALTPAYSNIRFDVKVYTLALEEGLEPKADGREFVSGGWYTVEEAVKLRDSGQIQLAPPTYRQLKLWLSCHRGETPWPSHASAFETPEKRNEEVLPFCRGVDIIPSETATLPPAAWTNTILLGEQNIYILDPGGRDLKILNRELDARVAAGQKLLGIILSHHHKDHIAGYHDLERLDVPLYCHPLTAELLDESFPKTTPLLDGDAINIEPDMDLVAHFTPGHAPGHLSFELPGQQILLAGDMISSLSSIVIPTSNGSLEDYLDSLKKLKGLDCRLIIPAHGPPYGSGSDPFGQALKHRQKREEQILTLLQNGPRTIEEIADKLYPVLDPRLLMAAYENIKQHLWKLQNDSLTTKDAKVWSLVKERE